MRYFFDFIIIFILLSCLTWAKIIWRSIQNQMEIKTKRARFFILTILAVVFIVVFYGSFIEPNFINKRIISLNLSKNNVQKEKIRCVFLTDWHLGYYKGPLFAKRVVKKVLAAKPDIILLGGDFLDRKRKPDETIFPIKKFSDKIPTFAVMGNHEYNIGGLNDKDFEDRTAELRAFFFANNITVLDNACQTISIKKQKINIAGIIDIWTGKADLKKTFAECDPRQKTVLLAHNPDVILSSDSELFDLILSGHTHAGQVRLPLLGSIYPIPDELGRKFAQGLFQLKKNLLYISTGLGEGGTRARLFNPPEITIVDLSL